MLCPTILLLYCIVFVLDIYTLRVEEINAALYYVTKAGIFFLSSRIEPTAIELTVTAFLRRGGYIYHIIYCTYNI